IVDEPTVGLDPEERVRFRNLIADLAGERIVLLSTHIVSDVEATATEIALINEGQLLKHSTPEQFLQAVEGKVWSWTISSAELTAVRQQHLISSTVRRSDGVHVRLVAEQSPDNAAQSTVATLEDAYLHFISKSNGHNTPAKARGVR
ncbi:MAG: ABC transporter ATP-binding protein, partial [Chloroflexi bacterium]|nr:ABC transporter ATP-binding protein [Chloroflexota bacterium]